MSEDGDEEVRMWGEGGVHGKQGRRSPDLFRDHLVYPRKNRLVEQSRRAAYGRLRPDLYPEDVREKLLRQF